MEQALEQAAPRRGRWWVRAALAIALFGLIGGLAELSTLKPNPLRVTVGGINDTQQIFGGIPQLGDRLGSANAPVTIQFFTDLQCASCRSQFLSTMPALVGGFLRQGRVKLELRHYSLGTSPVELGFFGAEAAAQQGYAWQYTYLFFRNQAEARRLGVDQSFLRSIAGAIAELDIPKWQDYFNTQTGPGGEIRKTLAGYDRVGRDLGLRTLRPTAIVSGPGGTRTLQDGPTLQAIEQAIAAVA